MFMESKSVIYDGEVYWDCLEHFRNDNQSLKSVPQPARNPKSSDYSESSSDSDDTPNDWKELAFEELGETKELRRKCLSEMRSWLVKQPHLKECFRDGAHFRLDQSTFDSDHFLLRFLRVQKFDVLKSCKMLDKYLEMRCDNPHWFMDLDPTDNKHVKELVNSGYVFVLPERDAAGRRVVFNYAKALDPSRHTSADIMKTFITTFETLLAEPENQIRGLTYVFYCKGLTLTHCSVWTPSDAATMFISCEKNLPIRHRSINLINLPFGMWAVFEFAKSFLSQKIRSRIVALSEDKKLSNRLGRDILPQEFGGSGVPLAQMTCAWWKQLCANKTRLEAMDTLIVSREPETPCVFSTPVKATPAKHKSDKKFWF